jgi:signal transduction histidine kinase
MESTQAIVILAIIHGLIFVALIAILLSDNWRRSRSRFKRLSRRESRIEQRIVAEAITACVIERELLPLLRSIGRRAAELNGFEEWLIWLRDKSGAFNIAAYEGATTEALAESLSVAEENRFFDWVRINRSPMVFERKAAAMADSEAMKSFLEGIAPALLIPFLDGQLLIGLLIVGGARRARERRSEQFLTLFGAFAAIMIRKVILDEEEARLRERQQRAENLASMGKVAAGIAHEIRNPLTFIRSAAEQLGDIEEISDENAELVDGIVDEIRRVNTRIEEMLSLGRMDKDVFELVVLEEVLQSSIRLAKARADERGIIIDTSIALDGVSLLASEDRLRQLFLNLMLNGIEAIPEDSKGTLSIKAHATRDKACVEIEDSGCGIDPQVRARIFEPFFTTKDSGTGLGLALCFSIARAHGGAVELKRTGPAGTCFSVELPLVG